LHTSIEEFLRLVQGFSAEQAKPRSKAALVLRAGGRSGTGNDAGRALKNWVSDSRSLGRPEGAGRLALLSSPRSDPCLTASFRPGTSLK